MLLSLKLDPSEDSDLNRLPAKNRQVSIRPLSCDCNLGRSDRTDATAWNRSASRGRLVIATVKSVRLLYNELSLYSFLRVVAFLAHHLGAHDSCRRSFSSAPAHRDRAANAQPDRWKACAIRPSSLLVPKRFEPPPLDGALRRSGACFPLAARAVSSSNHGPGKFQGGSNVDLGATDKVRPLIAAVQSDGARRDHAARGGIRGRGRARRRPLQADRAPHRDPRVPQGQGARQGLVELLADRLRQGLRPDDRRICLSRRGNGLVLARLRGLQLLGPRHRQHGSASSATARPSRRRAGCPISSKGARARPI